MVTVLKQGTTKENIRILLKKISKKQKSKGIKAHKYCGRIKLKEDALEIQKKLRNEWE